MTWTRAHTLQRSRKEKAAAQTRFIQAKGIGVGAGGRGGTFHQGREDEEDQR